MEIRCSVQNCPAIPVSCCQCLGYNSLFCQTHISQHVKLPTNHNIISLPIFLNQSQLGILYQCFRRLTFLYVKNSKQILKDFKTAVSAHIAQLNKIIKNYSDYFQELTKNYQILQIMIFNCFQQKTLKSDYKLLQTLIKKKKKNMCLNYLDLQRIFMNQGLVSSNSNNASVMLLNKEINHFGIQEKNFQIPVVSRSSKALAVSRRHVLITGGLYQLEGSWLINTSNNQISTLPNLKQGRKFHTMTFLNNYPAVIGGICNDDQTFLSSVQVLGQEWVIDSYLNRPRANLSACQFQESVFVVGGNLGQELLGTIEKYSHGTWKSIDTIQEMRGQVFGVVNVGSKILVMGGLVNGELQQRVFEFNPQKGDFKERECLQIGFYFPNNSWVIRSGLIIGYGDCQNEKKLISFKI